MLFLDLHFLTIQKKRACSDAWKSKMAPTIGQDIVKHCKLEKVFGGKSTNLKHHLETRDCRGRDRMAVGFTTTYAISAYHH